MANQLKKMVGLTFNRLTVIERSGSTLSGEATYTCSCVCGKVVVVRGSHLRDGHIKSCGCLKAELDKSQAETMLIDMVGEYVGGWNVIRRDLSQPYTQAHWICRCAYCSKTERVYSGWSLRSGRVSEGCGCNQEG